MPSVPPKKPDVDVSAPTLSSDPSASQGPPTGPQTAPSAAPTPGSGITPSVKGGTMDAADYVAAAAEGAIDASLLDAPLLAARAPSLAPAGFEDRYETRKLLGEGGMGEVHLCRDRRIGRDVAMKVVRKSHGARADVQARFLREARVQGQLEHPAIVPVHDLGVLTDGSAFFTMKRIVGRTLEQVLSGLRKGDPKYRAKYSRRKLLTAFGNACLAVAFAHARGVVHRDLKPANIMLGEFGEVNVLDWGVAKVVGAPELVPHSDRISDLPEPGQSGRIDTGPETGEGTRAGSMLGTPGYMAPEQVRGDESIDARADVYALGAILFEILALEPLHQSDNVQGLLADTLRERRALPSERRPDLDVPPELDRICERATALDVEKRYESVRSMNDDIDHFLDGDRDLELRREIAARHMSAAHRALDQAAHGEGDTYVARARAIRELSSVLTFDPTNEHAVQKLVQALGESLQDVPPAAQTEYEDALRATRQSTSKQTAAAYLSGIVPFGLIAVAGIQSWPAYAYGLVTLVTVGAYAWWSRKSPWTRGHQLLALVLAAFVLTGLISVAGPFVLVPAFAAVTALVFTAQVRLDRTMQYLTVTVVSLAVTVPFVLQLVGVLPQSYSFDAGNLIVRPWLTKSFSPEVILFLLWFVHVQLIVVPGLLVGRAVELLVSAEKRLFAHAWNLRHLVPEAAHEEAEQTLH